MITVTEYFDPKGLAHPEVTSAMVENAEGLLVKVNALLTEAESGCGYVWEIDADTGSCISGSPPREHKSGDGGFRLGAAKTGVANSKHKLAHAVDVFDPANRLDTWLNGFETGYGHNTKLAEYGLYREAPGATPGWCHLQDLAPGSGRQTFNP